MTSTAPIDDLRLRRKLRIKAEIVFDTAWRIGSGKEGPTMSDLGVLLDPNSRPLLPGSSVKGKLRTTCETLAHVLDLSACLLNQEASGVKCVSDVQYYSKGTKELTSEETEQQNPREEYKAAMTVGVKEQLDWIANNTCDVCKLFGSPVRAARLRCSDGKPVGEAPVVQVRDGVVLDRDSHTAVSGLKYDYEVVPAGTSFQVEFDLENPTQAEEALFGAALFDWHTGNSIGGFTSRGLGRFHLDNIKVSEVDLENKKQFIEFLTKSNRAERWADLGPWDTYFQNKIKEQQS